MRPREGGLALTAAIAITSACSSEVTQTSLRSAEDAASVRAIAASVREARSPLAPSAIDDAALERPVGVETLEEAALARQPSLAAAAHRIRATVERARAEGKLPPPELMADVWQVPFAKPYAFDRAAMIMVSIRQQFPAAGALDKMSEAMAIEAQAEAKGAAAEARAIVREVDRAFAGYVEASARLAAHEAHRQVVAQMIAAARARYQTGGALGDFTRAELEAARTQGDVERDRGMIDEARAKLNGLLARPESDKLGAPQSGEPRTVAMTAEQIAAIAAEGPEAQMAEHMARSARVIADAADREAKVPMFTAGLSVSLPTNDMPAGYGLSLSMSLPWAWGAAAARARSADQKALAARAAAGGARLKVRTEAVMALAAVRSAERRYAILSFVTAPAAGRAVEATRAGYAAGGADILMWLDAARTALDVELDRVMARGDLDRALADLDWAAGKRIPRAPITASKEPHHAK